MLERPVILRTGFRTVSSIFLARYANLRDTTDRGFYWLVSWDLMSQITWSSEMGFMKTGSDIKSMIYIGELSMMYLGLVCIFYTSCSPLGLLRH